ncbi:hypothetical protein COH20_012462 [Aspergillus flavus]|nr:hypothetical protein COH20_012462 [Aspergillus flavus]RAQ66638.1 hypothetical protein COH21_011718 [Aspergillus flavus]
MAPSPFNPLTDIPLQPEGVDWNIYGYGTSAYRKVLKAALQAHKDHSLLMDFSMGPQSGQGVPAEPDNPGLVWELVSHWLSRIFGEVPGWGKGDLVSAVTFAVLNTTTVTQPPPQPQTPLPLSPNDVSESLFSLESLTELTDSISQDGKMTVNVSSVKEATSYMLYASYARRSYARACTASSENHQNILQNGSFAVDHFSVMGAKLMEETGNFVWEDSVEIPSYTYWTPSLPEIFKKQHGYTMTPYLMLLLDNEGYQAGNEGPIHFISDGDDQGAGFVADYRSTMTGLLMEYLEYLNKWTHDTLGLKLSQQVGYNLPVDMLEAIPSVDIPETETLSFSNLIDGFRQFSGPANLAGKNVISIELGADFGQAYYQTWTELLQEAQHAFVAGVNQLAIHDATYSHTYDNATWPGFTSFNYSFAEQHSRHQPGWDVGYKQAMDYLARCQFILQEGIAKVDLVFWDKQIAQDAYPVENDVLAPQQQAFKAMILRGNDTLTVAGLKALVKYAKSGLPIILSGGLSSTWASNDEQAILQSEKALKSILDLDNTTDSDVYVYVYNDGDFSTGSISFQATGSPFALDAWTGEETPITEYSVSQGRTNISFSLKSTETRIVKFSASRKSANNESHVIWSSDSVLGYYVDSGKVWAKAAASDSATSVKLSSGKTVTLDQQGQSQISLGNWSVVLEQWLPPDNLYDVETVANKKNVSLSVSGFSLSSWKDLGYQNSSGVA